MPYVARVATSFCPFMVVLPSPLARRRSPPPVRDAAELLLHRFDGNLDRNFVADHRHGLQNLVERDPEVLTVDRRRRQERHTLLTPRVLLEPAEILGIQDDRPGHPADRQVAVDLQAVAAHIHATAAEL